TSIVEPLVASMVERVVEPLVGSTKLMLELINQMVLDQEYPLEALSHKSSKSENDRFRLNAF
ncbi:hypothetical protein HK102_011702, partial [Quaeritorhiza haematococci]